MELTDTGYILVLASFILVQGPVVTAATSSISDDLYTHLFSNYTTSVIPICASDGNVTLEVDMALRQVMNLNEREQILTTNVWIRMKWNDCRLTWDPASYNNVSHMLVPFNNVWIPDITLYDSAADEVMFPGKEDYYANIYSSGTVYYNFPTVVTSVCRVNVKYFPFDTQSCRLQFGSWSHHGLELDIVSKNPTGDLSNFIKNNELIVDEFPVKRHVVYYACCVEPYPDVTFYVILTRRPAFSLMTMLFPCILVSFVAATVFLLPVESGEKVSLEITVLLSLAVFLLVVSETLPPASDNFPIIGSYFAAAMVLVSLSLLQTILVLNVFYRGTNGRQVPRWAKIIFFQYLGRLVCSKHAKVHPAVREEKTQMKELLWEVFHMDLYPGLRRRLLQEHITIIQERVVPLNFKLKESKCNGLDPDLNSRDIESDPDRELGPENGRRTGILPSLALQDPVLRAVQEQTQSVQNIEKILHEKHEEEENNSDWRDLANIMDRVFLLFYVIVTVIVTLSFLLQPFS